MRGRHLFAIDTLGIVLASFIALSLRYDRLLEPGLIPLFLPAQALILAVRTVANVRCGLYGHRWHFASIPELERIVGAVLLGSVVSIGLLYGAFELAGAVVNGSPAPVALPPSFWVVEMFLTLTIVGGVRIGIRAACDLAPATAPATKTTRRAALLYGAGRAGVLVARSAMRDPKIGLLPLGFLDDDVSLAGGYVAGIQVFGSLAALPAAVEATGAQTLLITMTGAPGGVVRRIVDAAMALDLEVRTVPSINDLLDGSVDAHRVRRVRVEDLLRRPIVTEHAPLVQEIIKDRTVLITGAGGSIGSELARQVLAIGPRRLILVDRAESPLYLIHRELELYRSRMKGDAEVVVRLANITNRAAMERMVGAEVPSVIFHAAAYKHVPMMESDPSDAIHVNVGGTLVMLDAAAAAGVEHFVLVSTDKAVRPSSVMGASKRVAEMLVADTARIVGRPYVSVRFGNVLGSTGSVVPIFQEQLEKGEPLTITHPDMTRFFMTIPEAAWLILDAAALGQTGDLFVLDMGEPVRIMDLARDLVRLAGRDPDSQPIEIVGLRPGEKLHEELFYAEEHVEQTSSPKVFRAIAEAPSVGVRGQARRLLAFANGENDDELREMLFDCAQGVDTLDDRDGSIQGPRPRIAIPIETHGEPMSAIRGRRGQKPADDKLVAPEAR